MYFELVILKCYVEKGPIDRFKIGLSDPRSKGPFSIIGLSDPRSIGPFSLKRGPIDRFKIGLSDPRSKGPFSKIGLSDPRSIGIPPKSQEPLLAWVNFYHTWPRGAP